MSTMTNARTYRAARLTALPAEHTADDTIRINGVAVAHNGEMWMWQDSGQPLDFDQCERYGLDGTGRRY